MSSPSYLLDSSCLLRILSESQLNENRMFSYPKKADENNFYSSIFVECASRKSQKQFFSGDFDEVQTADTIIILWLCIAGLLENDSKAAFDWMCTNDCIRQQRKHPTYSDFGSHLPSIVTPC
jgi:hypothetical protein